VLSSPSTCLWVYARIFEPLNTFSTFYIHFQPSHSLSTTIIRSRVLQDVLTHLYLLSTSSGSTTCSDVFPTTVNHSQALRGVLTRFRPYSTIFKLLLAFRTLWRVPDHIYAFLSPYMCSLIPVRIFEHFNHLQSFPTVFKPFHIIFSYTYNWTLVFKHYHLYLTVNAPHHTFLPNFNCF
jgi:hypothetical protein